MIAVVGFVLMWTYFGGLNGFFFQSSDWDCRNAIYHDLIELEWPVIYESTGAALVYYIGHWLPPALVGKAVLWLTGSIQWAWLLGKMAFWVWTCVGLMLVIGLLFCFLKAGDRRKRIWAVILFVGFSGMDIIGAIYKGNLGWLLSYDVMHLEWWSKYQFSSITTCVYWVFNQAVIPWIITLCFLMENDPRNYVFYCTACLLCGPLPCVGLVICMIVQAAAYVIGNWKRKGTWKRFFSPVNLASLLCVFPFIAAYILANNAVGAAGISDTAQIALVQFPFFSQQYWDKELLCFLAVEVGCYLFFLFPTHKKDPLFYALIVTFVIAPYIHIGATNDFCMRASVPGILILMLYVNEHLLNHFTRDCLPGIGKVTHDSARQICALGLALCFLVGMTTPILELFRGVYHVIREGTILLEDMSIGSFDNGTVYLNFNCTEPEKAFFFRYMAR